MDKRGSNIKEDRVTSTIENLPREIMLDILSRLSITSLMQAKLVSRFWLHLTQDPLLASMHFTCMSNHDPSLIDIPTRSQFYFVDFTARDGNITDIVKRIRLPAMMPEFNLVGSCNGLLCVCDSFSKTAISIFNPFTRDYMQLPEPEQFSKHVSIAFGFDPLTKKYKVVRIVCCRNANVVFGPHPTHHSSEHSSVQILTLGSSTWRSIGEVAYQLKLRPYHVLVNGRIHWLGLGGRDQAGRKIISFDFTEEQFPEVAEPEGVEFKKHYSRLVNIGGCLSAVFYHGPLKLHIWIMKEYGVKESWTKEFIIAEYLPRGLNQPVDPSFKFSMVYKEKIYARVICLLKNGEILLEYGNRSLVSFDPVSEKFKELKFQGMPNWFETVVHTGSLNWIDTPIAKRMA